MLAVPARQAASFTASVRPSFSGSVHPPPPLSLSLFPLFPCANSEDCDVNHGWSLMHFVLMLLILLLT